jgi:condensin complex subunit 1
MRQAIVEVIGSLITELANVNGREQTDPKQNQKQISGLFQLLLDRVLDNSSYVRSKVFAVLAKLINIKAYKFPKHRLQITTTAVSALDDKNSSVRKAAASLLVQLLFTHPYVLHGGMLQREIWEGEYKKALDKIEGAMGKAVEDNNEQEEQEEEGKKKSRKKIPKKYSSFSASVFPYLIVDRSKKAESDEKMDVDGENERNQKAMLPRLTKITTAMRLRRSQGQNRISYNLGNLSWI